MRFNKRNKRKLIAINKEDGGALRMDEDERKKLVNNVEVSSFVDIYRKHYVR